ncbi:hypothetical protein HAZT_HAZT009078 [Hyalella azteca]|uniref:TMEM205-like domain-containing protein n=1 Tax=Hyalella azteca TaxID=294128 RepID=A0A6A0H3N7_HYAAZ|nr:hypothetical protein HAZT_HAZT009078 [Hyalella azteca]
MFPLYFLVKAALLLLALLCFIVHKPFEPSSTRALVQSSLLTVAFLTNLVVRVHLAPHLTRLIAIKMAIESEEGLGGEVGSTAPGRLSHCPHYMKLHRAFRRVHSTIAAANMASLTCTAILVSYQALKFTT